MPDVRDPDDLHDLLQTLVVFPAPVVLGGWELLDRKWKPEMMALEAKRRAVVAHIDGRRVLGRLGAHAGVPHAISGRELRARAAKRG